MSSIEYVEDALEEFLKHSMWDDIDWQDNTILTSLMSAVNSEGALTRKQGYLLLKILTKYQTLPSIPFDLNGIITAPKWRRDFRKLDLTKSIVVEKDNQGMLWFIMKFPYSLLKEFETAVSSDNVKARMSWDSDRKIKKLSFYDFNIVVIDEFVRKHNFEVDDTFVDAVSMVEEIWQQSENVKPHSIIEKDRVMLVNAVDGARDYFKTHATGIVEKDLFLAKSMGFPVELHREPASAVEKISQDTNCHFWIKTNTEFLQLYKTIDDITVIILDRNTKNTIEWLEAFINDAKSLDIDTSEFRICFREPKDSEVPLNDWIKKNNLGGSVDNGKLFIFKQKPAKWLFNNNVDVKIIATNNYTPINEPQTLHWTQSHPCVCYISSIEPTNPRNKQIAPL